MWTADSINITADQTCWTADGYNGCEAGGGGGYALFHPGYTGQPLQPDRSEHDRKSREDREALREQIRQQFADKIEADPQLRLMSDEDKEYILAQDDIEGIIAVLLLS